MPRKKKDLQAFAANIPVPEVSFDLLAIDHFIVSQSVEYYHYKAIPSPIGLKQRGDWRRSDTYDDISTNGYIYKKAGSFSAVMMSNSRSKKDFDGGFMDEATSRITFPRFYDVEGEDAGSTGKRIYLAPGDKIYIKNENVDTKVVHFQEMEYEADRDNVPQYPIDCVEYLVDSRGINYESGTDYLITSDGNVKWKNPAKSPGIDPETGKGRVYSIRYLYKSHWYIVSLPNEVRIGKVTEGDQRVEARYPYQAYLVREYIYHNRKNSKKTEQKQELNDEPSREVPNPSTKTTPGPFVKVSMSDIEDVGDES